MTQVAICLVIPQRMRLSGIVIEIQPLEVLPSRLFQERRSVGRQYYTDFIYFSSLR